MPSTYSQNLRVELIANGEQSGTWGNTTNVNLGTILDSAIAGYTEVTVGSATNLALTANNGAADQSRNMIVQLNSATGGNFNLFIPPASKFYVIRNNTVSSVVIGNSTALNGTTSSGGTTVTIKTGVTSLIFSDGTNVREALNGFAGSLDVNGNLVVNGNTTLGTARLAGTYSQTTTTVTVTTATAHGYTDGDSIGFIAYTGSGSPAVFATSGTYTITVTGTTSFTFTASPSQTCTGSCFVTNDTITLNGIVQPGVVIEGSSSTVPAMRITAQSGTAAALVVDDQSNPDSTPFTIDSSGNLVKGYTSALAAKNSTGSNSITPTTQIVGTSEPTSELAIFNFSTTDSSDPSLVFYKSLNADVGTYTTPVTDGTQLGLVSFFGSDGAEFSVAAAIGGFADGEFNTGTPPGDLSDSPGRLVFSTTLNGTDSLLERMRIDNAGDVIIGRNEKTVSPVGGILRAPNTGTGSGFTDDAGASLTIAAGNGTGTGGSGSILFQTAPVSTTNNTANTLATVMAIANTGNVGIGSTALTDTSLRISKDITDTVGGTAAYGIYQDGTVQSITPAITTAIYNNTSANTQATTFTLGNLTHYRAAQDTFGAGSTVTAQYAFSADATLIGATNNYGFYAENTAAVVATKTAYGFYSAVNTATGGGTAYGFYAAGTAVNSFSNLLIGGTTARTARNSTGTGGMTPAQQIIGTTEDTSSLGLFNYATSTSEDPSIAFSKSLNATVGSFSQTTNGTQLGGISFNGVGLSTDTAFATAAYIRASVNSATLATGSVPGQLIFGTTNVGGTYPADRMTLDNRGVLSIGIAAASGAALTTTAPAKLYIDNPTYTDTATTAGGIVTHGTISAIRATSIASSAVSSITYTSASTLYIAGAPTEGSNVNITYPYALFIDSGNMRLDGYLTQVGSTSTAIVVPLTIEGLTTATPADNITTALNFRTQTGATTVQTGAAIRAIATDVSTNTEDFDLSFLTMDGGDAIPTTATGNTSERLRLKSTGALQFDSGYGSVATAYGCRAWATFKYTTSVVIDADGNVATITRTSTGLYTVTFTTAMPNANYAVVGSAYANTVASASNGVTFGVYGKTASGFNINITDPTTNSYADPDECSFSVFR